MRPLFHPSLDDITLEGILHALSDPVRVQIFMEIAGATKPMSCASLCDVSKHPIPKSTLSQHFKILRESGLIRSERQGVELKNLSRCEEINGRFPGLIPAIAAAYRSQTAPRSKRRSSIA